MAKAYILSIRTEIVHVNEMQTLTSTTKKLNRLYKRKKILVEKDDAFD